MALSVGRPRGGVVAEINVTPLIDVLLVLLILFLVVTPVAPRGFEAGLPEKDHGREPRPSSLVLEVRAEDCTLNAAPVLTLPDLEARLRAAFETRRDATLFVRTADDVSYARLVAALDAATAAGASRIGLADDEPR